MKQTITTTFCILLFTVFSINSNAQSGWIDSGAVWHHKSNTFSPPGYWVSTYTNDTIVNNIPYQKVVTFGQSKNQTGINSYTVTPLAYVNTNYYTKSNDSIFILSDTNKIFVFKTNAQVGDVWNLGGGAFAKVDSVYFLNYNSQSLRNISLYAIDSLGNTITWDSSFYDYPVAAMMWLNFRTTVNEKFGPLMGFAQYYKFPVHPGLDVNISSFLCYSSSIFNYSDSIDCFNDVITDLSEKNLTKNISLYPNPTNETLNISNNQNIISYQITLLDGSCVYKGYTFPIKTSQLANGIYFLTTTDKYKQQTNYKFIKN